MTSAENPDGIASHPVDRRFAGFPAFLQLVFGHTACSRLSFNLAALSHIARTRQPRKASSSATAAVRACGTRNCLARSGPASLPVEQGASRAEKGPVISI